MTGLSPKPQLGLLLESPGRTLQDVVTSLCLAAGEFRGRRGEWRSLRARFQALYDEAQALGATQTQLAAMAEQVAPVGSLWTRTTTGPRYQLRRWEHQVGAPRPRPFAVLDATGEGEGRRRPHLKQPSAELLGVGSRWRRVQ